MFSWTNVCVVIRWVQSSSSALARQLAVDQQVGDLQVAGLLGQLLDRVAAVLEDALVTIDVGDRRATGGGIHERRVVGHQTEVVVVDLDLAQLGGADRLVLDRDLVGLAGAVVDDRQRVRAGYARVAMVLRGLSGHGFLSSSRARVGSPHCVVAVGQHTPRLRIGPAWARTALECSTHAPLRSPLSELLLSAGPPSYRLSVAARCP